MESFGSNAIQMELKYCERCGGLWLRLRGSDVVFCPTCAIVMAGIARDPRFLAHGNAAARRRSTEQTIENTSWSKGGNA